MMENLHLKLSSIKSIYYKMFVKYKVSSSSTIFKNICYVGFGTFIATIFSFTFNILIGRFLGPSMYGTYTLIESVAMFLYIPMLMGFHAAMVKYNSERKDIVRQKIIISTTYLMVFFLVVFFTSVYILLSTYIMKIFSISSEIYYYSIVFAIFYVLYTLSTETLRSLHEMKKYSSLKILFSLLLLLSFLFFITINFKSPKSVALSMYISYGVITAIILYDCRKHLTYIFDKQWAKQLTKYSVYAIMGAFSFAMYSNIDKLVINMYMDPMAVGIYRAYNYSFTSLIMTFTTVFTTVFFPYASMHENKQALINRIDRMVIYLILVGLPLSIICGLIILDLFGNNYAFDMLLAFLFSLAGIIISITQIYEQIVNSVGVRGIKMVSFGEIIAVIVNTTLNIWMIPLIGIKGAIIATIISYITLLVIINSKRKSIL